MPQKHTDPASLVSPAGLVGLIALDSATRTLHSPDLVSADDVRELLEALAECSGEVAKRLRSAERALTTGNGREYLDAVRSDYPRCQRTALRRRPCAGSAVQRAGGGAAESSAAPCGFRQPNRQVDDGGKHSPRPRRVRHAGQASGYGAAGLDASVAVHRARPMLQPRRY